MVIEFIIHQHIVFLIIIICASVYTQAHCDRWAAIFKFEQNTFGGVNFGFVILVPVLVVVVIVIVFYKHQGHCPIWYLQRGACTSRFGAPLHLHTTAAVATRLIADNLRLIRIERSTMANRWVGTSESGIQLLTHSATAPLLFGVFFSTRVVENTK